MEYLTEDMPDSHVKLLRKVLTIRKKKEKKKKFTYPAVLSPHRDNYERKETSLLVYVRYL